MKNNYRIIDYTAFGLPCVEVHGEQFAYQDLYELVGKQRFMTTFNFKEDSEAYNNYGESVTGVIHATQAMLKKIESSALEDSNLEKVQINSTELKLSEELHRKLKYQGIKISDIESISFLPYSREVELHSTGEKKVPNIVEVEVDFEKLNIDTDQLQLSYLIKKNNDEVELIDYEKEQIIGLLLGKNDGHIDSRVLAHFGFDKKSMENNLNILSCYFKVKENRNSLSDEQKERYLEIQDILNMQKIIKILQKINESNVKSDELIQQQDTLKIIMDSAINFHPSILSHGKKQIYWDLESYLHIVMRHIKNYQIGVFKEKTSFPYKPADLNSLIEQVIRCIEKEYRAYRLKSPDKTFTRHGGMAVLFNGDYYHLRIESDGRLSQFHAAEPIKAE